MITKPTRREALKLAAGLPMLAALPVLADQSASAAPGRPDSGAQPKPVTTLVATLTPLRTLAPGQMVRDQSVTSIARTWEPGDTQRCRLCDRCTALNNTCLVMVNRRVEPKEAALFSLSGFLKEVDPPGA